MILLSRAEEIILLAVYKQKGNAYGVSIREQVFKDIGRHWSFGVIYKTLKKMKAKGYVRKISSAPVSERGGRSKYYYELTPEGISALEKIKSVHSSLWRRIRTLSIEQKAK
ncbi:MAG: PadR family transcriptional regulator [Candidatus Aminicenantes bacterium]|nr:PadR family transcriptional regulator [Candidatus Aminicenantes bacterium]